MDQDSLGIGNFHLIDKVFRKKDPKRYIQVKTKLINGGSQIIAICSDITRIKELEEISQKMRAMFFSSIAHELRTPLNSIIPMIQMILNNFLSSIDERVANFLKIILNSALHLQNVIEDALDMSRIENNKFTMFKSMFDIEEAVKEVA
jgi:signal transduction histidine kinase